MQFLDFSHTALVHRSYERGVRDGGRHATPPAFVCTLLARDPADSTILERMVMLAYENGYALGEQGNTNV